MSLLRILAERGGLPMIDERQRQDEESPPQRGIMPWNSGFEASQQQMLEELLMAMKMRQKNPARAMTRMMLPMKMN